MLEISRPTFSQWLLDQIVKLPPFRSSVQAAQKEDVLELDELWSGANRSRRTVEWASQATLGPVCSQVLVFFQV
jgi:hypothetical protein